MVYCSSWVVWYFGFHYLVQLKGNQQISWTYFLLWIAGFKVSIPSILFIFVTGGESESDVVHLRLATTSNLSSLYLLFVADVHLVGFSAVVQTWLVIASSVLRLPWLTAWSLEDETSSGTDLIVGIETN